MRYNIDEYLGSETFIKLRKHQKMVGESDGILIYFDDRQRDVQNKLEEIKKRKQKELLRMIWEVIFKKSI